MVDIKNVVILGSTGSIGRQAVEVILARPDEFRVIGLAANANVDELGRQAEVLRPKNICLVDEKAAGALRERVLAGRAKVLVGKTGLVELCALSEADVVINAIVGSAGLAATLAAVEGKKQLALANKESLVAAGDLVMQAAKKSGAKIIPVDSEHSAIWQCLVGEEPSAVSKLIITASGGPFRGRDLTALASVAPDEALAHPRWRMGPRITIDSATLMNKGFEVIEAHYLFDMAYEQIEVLIHPECIVHSVVQFVDGSQKAQLGPTDMRLPILYALSWPKRIGSVLPTLDLAKVGQLNFEPPVFRKTPCLRLAFEAGRRGLSCPAVLNAADEVAVAGFLGGMIRFNQIGDIVERVLEAHQPVSISSIADFERVDDWARAAAAREVRMTAV